MIGQMERAPAALRQLFGQNSSCAHGIDRLEETLDASLADRPRPDIQAWMYSVNARDWTDRSRLADNDGPRLCAIAIGKPALISKYAAGPENR